MYRVGQITHREPSSIFLDNLKAHHSTMVINAAHRNRIELIYNGTYSSELNPVELVFGIAKRIFRQKMINFFDYKNDRAL
jgi:transposase